MTGAVDAESVQFLKDCGFNETETLVYCELLKHPGSTGYRVAQSIGKAQASAYAALAGLESKGAVAFDDSQTRSYRAVPPQELLGRLRRQFEQRCEATERRLGRLAVNPTDDRVYQLRHADQVYERARTMLREAQETVLFQFFPGPLAELRADLAAAAARGVKVVGLILRPEDAVEGARCVLSRRADNVLKVWPGQQITLIVDARRFLASLLEHGDGSVRHALLGDSIYLACLFHNAILSDVILHAGGVIDDFESPNRFMFDAFPPGLRQLLEE